MMFSRQTNLFRAFPAILLICAVMVPCLSSCATAAPISGETVSHEVSLQEPAPEPAVPVTDPYPDAAKEVVFRSQGTDVFRSGISETGDFAFPNDPVRGQMSFNGWWVSCDEGVVPLTGDWVASHPGESRIIANARWTNTSFVLEPYATFGNTQDGSVYGDYIFRFNASGLGMIHDMSTLRYVNTLALDSVMLNYFKPHSNCTSFGCTYYEEGDEFPLFYSNAYNNYDVKIDRLLGTVGVYRITREDRRFTARLVQVIRIGFASDKNLWMSGIGADKSPYGNMVVDTENGKLWFFVPRDTNKTTRFFCFDIPTADAGEFSETFGVNLVTLREEDILDMFDVPYSNYLQGACYHDGKIYSTEGMGTGVAPNGVRIIDLNNRIEDSFVDFFATKYWKEAEFIDFWNEDCYFSDFTQQVYRLTGIQ